MEREREGDEGNAADCVLMWGVSLGGGVLFNLCSHP